MKTLNIHDAKTSLARLLAEIEKSGKRIVIPRNSEPVADFALPSVEVLMVTDKHWGRLRSNTVQSKKSTRPIDR
jgi:antitoxin (DNA-binding transcriptional repressor) of toxin-antitoxin stability system